MLGSDVNWRNALLRSPLIGIALIQRGDVIAMNDRLTQMFGSESGLRTDAHADLAENTWKYVALAQAVGAEIRSLDCADFTTTLVRRDGTAFDVRVFAQAIEKGDLHAEALLMVEDITERRRVEDALSKARDEAQQASLAKSRFLANMSHEIRTPLNALVGLAQLARNPELEEWLRMRYLDQICESADTLSVILSDILDLSKIEAGKLRIDRSTFDLHGLLGSVQKSYSALAESKGLTFELCADPAISRYCVGDAKRLRQVLANFLSNALKFTARGRVVLSVFPDGGHCLAFSVSDTGTGIPEDALQAMFNPFNQVDNSATRNVGGTGLGLSICRELASLMDGAVGVDSLLGVGSTFWLRIPLPQTEFDLCNFDVSAFGSGLGHDAHVLIVDDNPVNMMIAAAMLEGWGARVTQAESGARALKAVDDACEDGQPFDLVLMDLQMPDMSGYEVARRLRMRFDSDTLPIVAVTASGMSTEREDAMECGMNGFLTKPIDSAKLRRVLSHCGS